MEFPNSSNNGGQKTWREYCICWEGEDDVLLIVGWRDANNNRPYPPDDAELAIWETYFETELLSEEEGKEKIKDYVNDPL